MKNIKNLFKLIFSFVMFSLIITGSVALADNAKATATAAVKEDITASHTFNFSYTKCTATSDVLVEETVDESTTNVTSGYYSVTRDANEVITSVSVRPHDGELKITLKNVTLNSPTHTKLSVTSTKNEDDNDLNVVVDGNNVVITISENKTETYNETIFVSGESTPYPIKFGYSINNGESIETSQLTNIVTAPTNFVVKYGQSIRYTNNINSDTNLYANTIFNNDNYYFLTGWYIKGVNDNYLIKSLNCQINETAKISTVNQEFLYFYTSGDDLGEDENFLDLCLTDSADGKQLVIYASYERVTKLDFTKVQDTDNNNDYFDIVFDNLIYFYDNSYYSNTNSLNIIFKQTVDNNNNYTVYESNINSFTSINDNNPSVSQVIPTKSDYGYELLLSDLDSYINVNIKYYVSKVKYSLNIIVSNTSLSTTLEDGILIVTINDEQVEDISKIMVGLGDKVEIYTNDGTNIIDGFRFIGWDKNGENININQDLLNGNPLELTITSSDIINNKITITANYIQLIYVQVKLPQEYKNTKVSNYVVKVNGELQNYDLSVAKQYDYGTELQILPTSTEYISFNGFTLNGESINLTNNKLILKQESIIGLNFKNVEKQLNVQKNTNNANGELQISNNTISVGKPLVIAFNANSGYALNEWFINDSSVKDFALMLNNTFGEGSANYSEASNTLTINVTEDIIGYLTANGFNTTVTTKINSTIMLVVFGTAGIIIICLLVVVFLLINNIKKKNQSKQQMAVASQQSSRMDTDMINRLKQ